MGATRADLIRADLDAVQHETPRGLVDHRSALEYLRNAQRDHDALRPEVAADRHLLAWEHNPAWRRLGAARYAEFYSATRALDFAQWHVIQDVLFIGLREAIDRDDLTALDAAMDSYARLQVAANLHSHGGLDHSSSFFPLLEASLTDGLALVNECVPAAAGLSSDNYPLNVVGTNLVWTTLHGSTEQRHAAMQRAERYVATKSHPVMEKKIIAYLLEVARGDAAAASSALAAISDDWVQSTWLIDRRGGVMIRFALLLHGLFLLGVKLLPAGAAALRAPTSPAFWPEYDEHLRSTGWKRPAPALAFTGEIAPLSQIYGPFIGNERADAPAAELPGLSFDDAYFPEKLRPFRPGSDSRARFEAAKPPDPFLAKLLRGSPPPSRT